MSELDTCQVEAYTALASIYDRVMDHVDYEKWAGYVDALLALHAPAAEAILELGAGTGHLAAELSSLRTMSLTLTDGSAEMIEQARRRLDQIGIDARTDVLDFLRPVDKCRISPGSFDAVLLLYDGFNYATSTGEVRKILALATHVLRPGGVFVFDQVTPVNSTNAANVFEDKGRIGDTTYARQSEYDAERRVHRTSFEIITPDGRFLEEHVQRIWSPGEVEEFISESDLEELAAYDGYSLQQAGSTSERIHRVLRRPAASNPPK